MRLFGRQHQFSLIVRGSGGVEDVSHPDTTQSMVSVALDTSLLHRRLDFHPFRHGFVVARADLGFEFNRRELQPSSRTASVDNTQAGRESSCAMMD